MREAKSLIGEGQKGSAPMSGRRAEQVLEQARRRADNLQTGVHEIK